jgi:hypothetical protein
MPNLSLFLFDFSLEPQRFWNRDSSKQGHLSLMKILPFSLGMDEPWRQQSFVTIGYVNTHVQLEAVQEVALAAGLDGPNVLIVGPSDHGKSITICSYE